MGPVTSNPLSVRSRRGTFASFVLEATSHLRRDLAAGLMLVVCLTFLFAGTASGRSPDPTVRSTQASPTLRERSSGFDFNPLRRLGGVASTRPSIVKSALM